MSNGKLSETSSSGWATALNLIGIVLIAIGLFKAATFEKQASGAPIDYTPIVYISYGLCGCFSAFLVNVLTDIRSFLQTIASK